jgi:hypothetical protein
VADRDVVRYEVQHQPEASAAQALPKSIEGAVVAVRPVEAVVGDGERRPSDVGVGEVREILGVRREEQRVGLRDAGGLVRRLPSAEEVEPLEPELRDRVEPAIGDVVEWPEDPGVDLVEEAQRFLSASTMIF